MKRFATIHDYFTEVTEESAYIAGYLMADGNIGINDSGNNYVQMNLHIKDECVIQFILDRVSPGRPISYYEFAQKSGHITPYARFKITSNKICEDLKNHYNIIPRKTGFETLPNITNIQHFIRGLFDGDGCITWKQQRHYTLSINSGSRIILDQIRNLLGYGSVTKGHGNCFVWSVNKMSDMIKFREFIYSDDNSFCLKRKKDLLNQVHYIKIVTQHEAFGEKKTTKEWAKDERCVITFASLANRIYKKQFDSFEEMLTTSSLRPRKCQK